MAQLEWKTSPFFGSFQLLSSLDFFGEKWFVGSASELDLHFDNVKPEKSSRKISLNWSINKKQKLDFNWKTLTFDDP